MILSLRDNYIELLVNDDEFKSAYIGQLEYYGFKLLERNPLCFRYFGSDLSAITIKTVNYLVKNNCKVTFSEDIQVILDREKKNSVAFDNLKRRAADFKNGIVEDDGFLKFIKKTDVLPRKLKEHQLKAAYHHYILKNSADFSVPGSGKTTTMLSVYNAYQEEGIVNCIFVVGPPSSFSAWKNEFLLTLGRSPVYKILAGINKNERIMSYSNYYDDTELFLTSFQSFANDHIYILDFFSHMAKKVFFIVDEAHYIKQIDGKWANAILSVGNSAVSKHVLTGTPCPKSYADLFNIFDLLWGKNKVISEREKAEIISYEKMDSLDHASEVIKPIIKPLFYRVRKNELGLTKPNFHEPILVQMNEYERRIYDSVYNRISDLSYFDDTQNILTLLSLKRGRIIRLRQLTSYVKLLETAIDDYSEIIINDSNLKNIIMNYDKLETPAKMTALLDLVNKIRQRDSKILIWSNFIETINGIEKRLSKSGLKCAHIYGSTPIISTPDSDLKTREEIIDEFLSDNSNIDILIANPGACAESISLHKNCHNAIYYDLSYNCAQYLQSLDRIHRVGGSEQIESHYYFLQYSNTIDPDIMENLMKKRDKMYNIIESDSDIYKLDISVYVDDDEEDKNAYDRIFVR